jgi:hypothetical protein
MPHQHQEGGVITAEAELGWPESNVAILLPDQAAHRTTLEQAGWTVFTIDDATDNPQAIAGALEDS